MVKLPAEPPSQLDIVDADLVDWGGLMVRIHATAGLHALPWHELRHYGPLPARFDPHPSPIGHHVDAAVSYVAAELDTLLAEVFQTSRTIITDAPTGPYLTVWRPSRPLRLLDVTGQWPIRNGASHVLNTGPHQICRAWARAISAHHAAVDGLCYTSSMTGGIAAALFLPATDSFPRAPELSLPLNHPGLTGPIRAAARRIGYHVE